ncbi:MAG: polysaccharide deacetylase family protein [Coriobacteriia bacterium]|nr:polysaccharide deacetylase family protein [Coriobacteriia bacterium]
MVLRGGQNKRGRQNKKTFAVRMLGRKIFVALLAVCLLFVFPTEAYAQPPEILYQSTAHALSAEVATQATSATKLPAPENVTAKKKSGSSIKVAWGKVKKAKQYSVYRSTAQNGTYKEIASLKGRSFADENLARGKTYFYKVKALGDTSKQNSKLSVATTGTTLKLAAPQSVVVSNVSPTKLKISWQAVDGAGGYEVYRLSLETGLHEPLATTKELSHSDGDLVPLQRYSYRVRAYTSTSKPEYHSSFCKAVSQKATLATPVPSIKWKKSFLNLSWKKVPGANKYLVYRKTPKAKNYTELGETTKLSFADKQGKKDKKYQYKICAYAEVGEAGNKQILQRSSKKVTAFYSRIDPTKPMIALTFDDGPSPYTKDIIKVLKKYDAHATFFVVGNRVKSKQKVLKLAVKNGNEIGNHTYSHPHLTGLSSAARKQQFKKTNDAVKTACSVTPKVMRPPYGSTNASVGADAGMPVIIWSIDTQDWRTRSSAATIRSVLSARDGDIVLMHDIHVSTRDATESFVSELTKRGFQLVTVSELAKYKGKSLKKGKNYHSIR